MGKDDLPTLILTAIVTFFITFAIGYSLFGSPKFNSDSVQIADPLNDSIDEIDQRVQNGLNPTEKIDIGSGGGGSGF